jgi:hypothetical protein
MSRRLPCLLCLLLAGCIVIPHDVEPDIAETDHVILPAEDILLTRGPRRFLEMMEEAVVDADPDIQIVDGMRFRDTAFPEGGWTLAQLQTQATRERLQQALAMDYLLLFGPLEYDHGSVEGPNTLTMGIPVGAGVGQVDEQSTLSGLVIDLATGRVVSQVDVTAAGSTSFAIWIIVAVGTAPDTGESAIKGMARALATEVRGHTAKPRPRVALLAAEAALLWKPIGSGGWTRVYVGDGVPIFHVFGKCGLVDAQVSLEQAFDRAMGLYVAEAWEASYDCFGFVREAGGDSHLVDEARQHMEFMVGAGLVKEPEASEVEEDQWQPPQ